MQAAPPEPIRAVTRWWLVRRLSVSIPVLITVVLAAILILYVFVGGRGRADARPHCSSAQTLALVKREIVDRAVGLRDAENGRTVPDLSEDEDSQRFETAGEEAAPEFEEEVRRVEPRVVPRSPRVRSFTREAPAEEQVSLKEESVEVETRPCERQLSESEVETGGLFQERVFEIAAMREEPVVTKVAVVREEVIVRKTLKARVETVRDTVRHTEVGVEALRGTEDLESRQFERSTD